MFAASGQEVTAKFHVTESRPEVLLHCRNMVQNVGWSIQACQQFVWILMQLGSQRLRTLDEPNCHGEQTNLPPRMSNSSSFNCTPRVKLAMLPAISTEKIGRNVIYSILYQRPPTSSNVDVYMAEKRV